MGIFNKGEVVEFFGMTGQYSSMNGEQATILDGPGVREGRSSYFVDCPRAYEFCCFQIGETPGKADNRVSVWAQHLRRRPPPPDWMQYADPMRLPEEERRAAAFMMEIKEH